jgi:4-azaleucine resistance transporter AzlC
MAAPRAGHSAGPLPERGAVIRAAIGLGLYAGAFGMSFGAVSVGSGLTIWQTMVLSVVLFSGASQFAFVGLATAGGSPFAAIPAAMLLGVRNAFYGVPLAETLRPRGLFKLWTAYFIIDETTAMAVAQATPRAQRYAFWTTGLILCCLWQLGSLTGALLGTAISPKAFGLDAAAPAVFLALLWPMCKASSARWVALGGAGVALVLLPLVRSGVPVIAAASVAVVAGLLPTRDTRAQADARPAGEHEDGSTP